MGKKIDEMVKGIKEIKYNGWEQIIFRNIQRLRKGQVYFNMLFFWLHFSLVYLTFTAPIFIAFIVLWGHNTFIGEMELAQAYFLISLCTITMYPLRIITNGLNVALTAYM